jgi:hypothetical protein
MMGKVTLAELVEAVSVARIAEVAATKLKEAKVVEVTRITFREAFEAYWPLRGDVVMGDYYATWRVSDPASVLLDLVGKELDVKLFVSTPGDYSTEKVNIRISKRKKSDEVEISLRLSRRDSWGGGHTREAHHEELSRLSALSSQISGTRAALKAALPEGDSAWVEPVLREIGAAVYPVVAAGKKAIREQLEARIAARTTRIAEIDALLNPEEEKGAEQ